MAVARIRNQADTGWIIVGGGVEVYQSASEPATTHPGMLWLDTDAETGVDGIGLEFNAGVISLKDNIAIFAHTTAAGVDGGSTVADAWTQRTLNTTKHSQSWASLSSNRITLNAGTYHISVDFGWTPRSYGGKIRLYNFSDSSVIEGGGSAYGYGSTTVWTPLESVFTLAAQKTIELQYYVDVATATYGLGQAAASTDGTTPECWCLVTIRRIK